MKNPQARSACPKACASCLRIVVRPGRLELPRHKTLEPKSSASANFATGACIMQLTSKFPGIHPDHRRSTCSMNSAMLPNLQTYVQNPPAATTTTFQGQYEPLQREPPVKKLGGTCPQNAQLKSARRMPRYKQRARHQRVSSAHIPSATSPKLRDGV